MRINFLCWTHSFTQYVLIQLYGKSEWRVFTYRVTYCTAIIILPSLALFYFTLFVWSLPFKGCSVPVCSLRCNRQSYGCSIFCCRRSVLITVKPQYKYHVLFWVPTVSNLSILIKNRQACFPLMHTRHNYNIILQSNRKTELQFRAYPVIDPKQCTYVSYVWTLNSYLVKKAEKQLVHWFPLFSHGKQLHQRRHFQLS